jgi:hypothetical protein
MLHLRGGYLYEHRPDVIPQGFVTEEELALWAAWYEQRAAQREQHRR